MNIKCKSNYYLRFLSLSIAMFFMSFYGYAFSGSNPKGKSLATIAIEVSDNWVRSDYFHPAMIGQELNISVDSISTAFYRAVESSLMSNAVKSNLVPASQLDGVNANYILRLNDYEIVYKQKPFITIIHNISYSFIDLNTNKEISSSAHFSTFTLESIDKMSSFMDRCTKRIMSSIERNIR